MSYSVDLLSSVSGAATGDWKSWPGGKGTLELDGTTFPATSILLEKKGPAGNELVIVTVLNATGFSMTNFETAAGQIRAVAVGALGVAVTARAVWYA